MCYMNAPSETSGGAKQDIYWSGLGGVFLDLSLADSFFDTLDKEISFSPRNCCRDLDNH